MSCAGCFPGIPRSDYQRLDREYGHVAPRRLVIDTPDKENAFLRARLDFTLRDDDADAPALYVANHIFGGSSGLSSRLLDRLRQKEGLSYSAGSSLSMGSRQRLSSWTVAAMVAPQNAARAEQAFLEEVRRVRATASRPARLPRPRRGLSKHALSRARRTAQSPRAGYLFSTSTATGSFPGTSRPKCWRSAPSRSAPLSASTSIPIN
jgi:zinc protease